MTRLQHPVVGTVVTLEGDLEESYRAAGWVDADSTEQDTASPEKPKRGPGRPRKQAEKSAE